jgi:hypothetical protein
MKRWIAVVVLVGWCSGCALFEEEPPNNNSWMGPPAPWLTQGSSGPPSSCYRPSPAALAAQTTEPELLQGK